MFFWEYQFAGVLHKVAIECKNYSTAISKGKVRDFFGVLSDIGNLSGIMVTKKGYQKGAKELAEYYGINLMVIRDAIDEDWKGRLRRLNTKIQATSFRVTNTWIELDSSWCHENLNIDEEARKSFSLQISGQNNEMWIVDEKGNNLKNFLQLENELQYTNGETNELKYYYQFENGYIPTKDFGNIKIKGVLLTYNVLIDKTEFTFDSKDHTKAIVKNALSGHIEFIKR